MFTLKPLLAPRHDHCRLLGTETRLRATTLAVVRERTRPPGGTHSDRHHVDPAGACLNKRSEVGWVRCDDLIAMIGHGD